MKNLIFIALFLTSTFVFAEETKMYSAQCSAEDVEALKSHKDKSQVSAELNQAFSAYVSKYATLGDLVNQLKAKADEAAVIMKSTYADPKAANATKALSAGVAKTWSDATTLVMTDMMQMHPCVVEINRIRK